MKIQQKSLLNFNGKYKLETKSKQQLDIILQKMNKEAKYLQNENGNSFQSTVLNTLVSDKVFLRDGRFFLAPVKQSKQNNGFTTIELKNSSVLINNKTGELDSINKPFYMPLFLFQKKLVNVINNFFEFFDDASKVEKRFLNISGFTKQGYSRIFKN